MGANEEFGARRLTAARDLVQAEMYSLLTALDVAIANPVAREALAELSEATDGLMRAGARVRLEAERLTKTSR
jgi:hypothetical protein